jgi:hypothetical protein
MHLTSTLHKHKHRHKSNISSLKQKNSAMSTLAAQNNNQIRNRKPLPLQDNDDAERPPVPPKPHAPTWNTTPATHYQITAATSNQDAISKKPLPLVPGSGAINKIARNADSKPLPSPPKSPILRQTMLWIMAFSLWFILIVILLPVITEKDAMPGFNKWLRNWSTWKAVE